MTDKPKSFPSVPDWDPHGLTVPAQSDDWLRSESGDSARTRGSGLTSPVRGRQVPRLGVSRDDPNEKRNPFTLIDDEPEEPSWHRRHDDIDDEKRKFWHGAAWGWCVGVVMTAVAVAWRLH